MTCVGIEHVIRNRASPLLQHAPAISPNIDCWNTALSPCLLTKTVGLPSGGCSDFSTTCWLYMSIGFTHELPPCPDHSLSSTRITPGRFTICATTAQQRLFGCISLYVHIYTWNSRSTAPRPPRGTADTAVRYLNSAPSCPCSTHACIDDGLEPLLALGSRCSIPTHSISHLAGPALDKCGNRACNAKQRTPH